MRQRVKPRIRPRGPGQGRLLLLSCGQRSESQRCRSETRSALEIPLSCAGPSAFDVCAVMREADRP